MADFLDRIVDKAFDLGDRFVALEFADEELALAKEVLGFKAALASDTPPRDGSGAVPTGNNLLLIVGGGAVLLLGVYLLTRKG